MSNQSMKKCPFCGEEIRAEAIKCRYCGDFLNELEDKKDDQSPPVQQDVPPPQTTGSTRKCPFCGKIVPAELIKCSCGMILNEPAWNALQKAQKNASSYQTVNVDGNQESLAMKRANRSRLLVGLGIFLFPPCSIPGVILGFMALTSRTESEKKDWKRESASRRALNAVIIGIIHISIVCFIVVRSGNTDPGYFDIFSGRDQVNDAIEKVKRDIEEGKLQGRPVPSPLDDSKKYMEKLLNSEETKKLIQEFNSKKYMETLLNKKKQELKERQLQNSQMPQVNQ